MLRGRRYFASFCAVCDPMHLKSKVVSVLIVPILMSWYMIAIGSHVVANPKAHARRIAPAQSSWNAVITLVLDKVKLRTREFDEALRSLFAGSQQMRMRCIKAPFDCLS